MNKAWKGEYQGQYHRLLYDNIAKMTWKTQSYGNTLSLIQSSATGKTRMVHEYASLVFAIPSNLREDSETDGLSRSRITSAPRMILFFLHQTLHDLSPTPAFAS